MSFRNPMLAVLTLLGIASIGVQASCPYAGSGKDTTYLTTESGKTNGKASIPEGGFKAVREDLINLFTDSKDFWPADFGNYAPFMIRLSWHCAGSYRNSDGRGGCDGGRIRHIPEFAWPDNANLDKALRLLEPVKEKYGDSLSWGDLIALVGDAAITSMGGPSIGFCGGRIDDDDGSASLKLGPSEEQESVMFCEVNGQCDAPLGPTTVGLIYVNPAGPLENNDPASAVADIRRSFGTMGMNDKETVALAGGGHAFGKVHGACETGPGPGPLEQPDNPYPGTCGEPGSADFGRGNNTYTSGFEGPWTTKPTEWTNDYFTSLLEFNWVEVTGPGGKVQWRPEGLSDEDGGFVRMLTTDIALLKDESYLEIVKEFAANITSLEYYFSEAWYKLVTRDMGPVTRCIGDDVPEARPFQRPLPPAGEPLAQDVLESIYSDIEKALYERSYGFSSDSVGYTSYNGALFVNLAFQCASTFRATDYLGGCNGATIRFSPESEFAGNEGTGEVIEALELIAAKHEGLSISDLIVYAGNVALEKAGAAELNFCQGRTDAVLTDELQRELKNLAPRTYVPDPIVSVRDNEQVMGLNAYDTVALAGRPRSPMQQMRLGYSGSYSTDPSKFSNEFYKLLLSEEWVAVEDGAEMSLTTEYKSKGKDIFITGADLVLTMDKEYREIVSEFAEDNKKFMTAFSSSWTKLMNADRFDGPDGNVCN